MGKNKKKRDRSAKSRITIDMSPDEMRKRREARENARLEREAFNKSEAKKVENWGPNLDNPLMAYRRHIGTEMTTERNGKVRGMWRSNPFTALVQKGTLSSEEGAAGQDLLWIYAASKGLQGPPEEKRQTPKSEDDLSWGAEDHKRYHIKFYGLILTGLSNSSRKIAEALCYALIEEDRPISWAGIVERETGATTAQRQSERIKMMAEELVLAIPDARKALKEMRECGRVA